jgi:hypothetical protein
MTFLLVKVFDAETLVMVAKLLTNVSFLETGIASSLRLNDAVKDTRGFVPLFLGRR